MVMVVGRQHTSTDALPALTVISGDVVVAVYVRRDVDGSYLKLRALEGRPCSVSCGTCGDHDTRNPFTVCMISQMR